MRRHEIEEELEKFIFCGPNRLAQILPSYRLGVHSSIDEIEFCSSTQLRRRTQWKSILKAALIELTTDCLGAHKH